MVTTAKRHNSTTSFEYTPIKTFLCDEPANNGVATMSKEEAMLFHYNMYMVRRTEIAADNLYKARQIRGFCHLYDGQEAVCEGMEAAITKEDSIITAYRDHGFQMTRMVDGERDMVEASKVVLAELMGREYGCAKGKGGSMHMYDRKNNFYGGNGIVGAHIPVGTGIAFEYKYSGLPNVCISPYGDGASNQGQFFEAINMASLWKIPHILVCENNHFGMGTSQERSSAGPGFYMRGAAHNVPGICVDGMDILAVRDATAYAKSHCVEGNGPIIIEFDTYRYHGHSMSDPGDSYRSKEDVNTVRATRDPIELLKKRIIDQGWADAAEMKKIEKSIRKTVDECAAFAKANPEMNPSQLFETVNVGDTGTEYYRGCDLGKGKNIPAYVNARRM